jgi:hypothetical protein
MTIHKDMTVPRVEVERLAYQLWELEGHPDGRQDVHWSQAETILGVPWDGSDSLDNPLPSPDREDATESASRPRLARDES